ncbi:hypothetical protein BGW36DRAFT_358094 [Talaromyces proteolyticus]|uniref:SH3 domain-containing protein n=1 Tax=Talaromyces proteolyticus TaxID=1131652 RepID=A0AAD4Q1C3_9EURO|nr:uncharacterized protein BGW36DRAFT_358094 [Talaromyces proteolyticus]KAH8698564.1 hypothetical protein BGW36DRAFT_358094 [Talaromyces proteolyticus]
MPHDHHHHHVKRDFISDVESWFGFGSDPTSTQDPNAGQTTAIVYVTMQPTFTGPVGGLVTETSKSDDQTTAPAGKGPPVQQTHAETTKTKEIESTSTSTSTTKKDPKTTHTTTHTDTSTSSTSTTTSEPSTTTTFSTAAATTSLVTTSLSAALDQATSSSTPSATPSASSSGGLSGGAKAGIAIGVLLGVAAIAGLILFWLHKQKQNRKEAEAAEAAVEAAAAAREKPFTPSPRPPVAGAQPPMSNAPNSSGPNSQFGLRPGANGNAYAAGGMSVAAVGAAVSAAASYRGSAHSPPGQDPFNDPANPFDTSSQSSSPPLPVPKDDPVGGSQVRDLTSSPTGSGTGIPSSLSVGTPADHAGETAAAGAVAGAAVAAAAVAKKSDEHPQQRTPSPEYREGSPDGGPGSRPQSPSVGGAPFSSNVHRVQMDFTPTLADEMELRAGQLVRILKAYDDGWAQCSSMDGSIRGIAPRSCLSARPLQPRRPPGPGQGPRGPQYMGPNGRPMSPAGGRGPPSGGPPRFYQDGRPMTPTGQGSQFPIPPPVSRSMSPDMPRPLTPGGSSRPSSPNGGRVRSNSSTQNSRPPIVQAGPSPLAPPTGPLPGPPTQAPERSESHIGRKPVPGSQ